MAAMSMRGAAYWPVPTTEAGRQVGAARHDTVLRQAGIGGRVGSTHRRDIMAEKTEIETHEVNIKARIPKNPNLAPDGLTEFPCAAILVYANGTKVTMPIRQPKPSAASGKVNAWGGGKLALEDNTQVQVGINLTVIE